MDLDILKKMKPRNKHSLPPELSGLTNRDRDKFVLVVEIDKTPRSATMGQEFRVAQSVNLPAANGNRMRVYLLVPLFLNFLV
jgi:hypothetical protein